MARETGDASLIWVAQSGLGMAEVSQGRGAEAAAIFRENCRLCHEMGATHLLGPELYGLGLAFQLDGEYDQARASIEDAATIFNANGERYSIGSALRALGGIALAQGQFAQALQYYRDGLHAAVHVNHREGIASALEGTAAALAALGKLEAAARLWGAAEALHEALFGPSTGRDSIPLARRPQLSPHLRAISGLLGEARWIAAQAEGHTAPLEETLASLEDLAEGAGR